MYKSVDLDFLIPLLSLGCLFFGAVYQTILARVARQKLFVYYAAYLWSAFFSVLLRCFWLNNPYQVQPHIPYVITVSFFWLNNILYVLFLGYAIKIRKAAYPMAYIFWRWSWVGILILWTAFHTVRILLPDYHLLRNLLFYGLNLLMLSLSIYLLIQLYRKQRSQFDKAILAGSFVLLVFYILTAISIWNFEEIWPIRSFAIICLGYIFEMLCFSYAIQLKAILNIKVYQRWVTIIKLRKLVRRRANQVPRVITSDESLSKTDQELIKKLAKFENSPSLFVKKSVSLASLASQFDTNTVYLSTLINEYRGKNFSTWLNDLRIHHLIELLKSNPQYRQFKVSYLAESSGFSAQSTFIKAFKHVTGHSPSEYIQSLS